MSSVALVVSRFSIISIIAILIISLLVIGLGYLILRKLVSAGRISSKGATIVLVLLVAVAILLFVGNFVFGINILAF